MKKRTNILIIISLVTLLSGCNMGSQNELSGVDLPLEQMNNDLTLIAPPELNEFDTGKYVGFVLANNANTPIILSANYGIHLYQLANNEWMPIEDIMDYGNEEKIIYPISEGSFQEVVLVAHPKVEMKDKPVTVRVVVVGKYLLANGNIGDEVGAYVDITLPPK
mgnify:CR=1 FL=1